MQQKPIRQRAAKYRFLDLMMQNPREKSIARSRKAILRVRKRIFENYPQSDFFHFSGSFPKQALHHQNDLSQFSDVKNCHKRYHQINKSYFNDTCEVRCS